MSKKKRGACASIAEAAGKGSASEGDLPIAERCVSRGRKEKEQNPQGSALLVVAPTGIEPVFRA